MSINANVAKRIVALLNKKVQEGVLDPESAKRLAVLAMQEVKEATGEEEPAPEETPPEQPEELAEEPVAVVDPQAQILAALTKLETEISEPLNAFKATLDEVLKGTSGEAFPLGKFDISSEQSTSKLDIKVNAEKSNAVEISLSVDRFWGMDDINPPAAVESSVEPSCHMGLRKSLLTVAEDMAEFANTELAWRRVKVPNKTLAYINEEASKENDQRILEIVAAAPQEGRDDWRKWSVAAQVYLLGNDYSADKKFTDIMQEIK